MLTIFTHKIKGGFLGVLAGVIFASLLLLTGGKPVHAAADTCTWTGSGGDSNITTAGNWTGCDNGTVPENGDSVTFPNGPSNKTVTIDAPREFVAVTFSGDSYTVETTDLANNQLFITSSLIISGNNNTFNAFVRYFNDSGATLTHSGTGTSFSHYLVIQPGAGDPDVTLDIQTDMSVPMISQTTGSVGLVSKTGNGTLDITGGAITGMTATGGITISAGIWKCDTTYCLGDNTNVINVAATGALEFAQSGQINVGTITGDGTVSMSSANAVVGIGNGNTSGAFSGTVEGFTDSIFEIIGGAWTFAGTNTDLGNGYTSYYINGGTFLANTTDTSLGSSPFSMSDGILGGNSTIGQISVYSGIVSPGNSPGCLAVNGDTAFTDTSSIYLQQIDGTTACTGYDQLNATGTIYLNDATLDLEVNLGLTLTDGQVFTIMSADAIDGTFFAQPDGSTVTIGSFTFRVNYTATSVTLTYEGGSTPVAASAGSSTLASTGQDQRLFTILATSVFCVSVIGFFLLRILSQNVEI